MLFLGNMATNNITSVVAGLTQNATALADKTKGKELV
jgi:uncharacterized protein YejL (UPF0352 family)